MKQRMLAGLAVAAVALTAAAMALARQAAPPRLTGTVGPGFTISLTSSGKKVTTLKAGTYVLAIADKANIHNFVLERLTPSKLAKTLTTVPFTGTKTITLTLTKGKWKYFCMPHQSSMFGFFVVK